MTASDRVYCRWCGTAVTGGGQYCPSCGREVERPQETGATQRTTTRTAPYAPTYSSMSASAPPLVTENVEESNGFVSKVLGTLGMAIGIPVMIVLSLISTALPILIAMALFMGPGDTWDMVKQWIPGGGGDNPACEGFNNWYAQSTDRSEQVLDLLEETETGGTPSPTTLRALATEVDGITNEQRRSNPPDEAVDLNGLMVDSFQVVADLLRAAASGDQSAIRDLMREGERLDSRYADVEEQVFDQCR